MRYLTSENGGAFDWRRV